MIIKLIEYGLAILGLIGPLVIKDIMYFGLILAASLLILLMYTLLPKFLGHTNNQAHLTISLPLLLLRRNNLNLLLPIKFQNILNLLMS